MICVVILAVVAALAFSVLVVGYDIYKREGT